MEKRQTLLINSLDSAVNKCKFEHIEDIVNDLSPCYMHYSHIFDTIFTDIKEVAKKNQKRTLAAAYERFSVSHANIDKLTKSVVFNRMKNIDLKL